MQARLLIILCAALWSTNGLIIKILTKDYGVAAEGVAFWRNVVAGIALAWAIPRIGRVSAGRLGAASACYALLVGTFVKATADASAAQAVFLQYLYPLLVAVGGWVLYRDPIDRRTTAALVLGTAGIVVILAAGWNSPDAAGIGCGLVSAFAFAAFVLLQRDTTADPIARVSIYNLVGAAILLPLAWGKLAVPGPAIGILVAMGIFQHGIPYVLLFRAMRTVPASEAALLTLLEPVLNPLWVWIGRPGEDQPGGWTIAGGGLILLALVVRMAGRAAAETAEARGGADRA